MIFSRFRTYQNYTIFCQQYQRFLTHERYYRGGPKPKDLGLLLVSLQHLTAGDSLNKFLEDFPTVSREQAVAYLKMALEVVDTRAA